MLKSARKQVRGQLGHVVAKDAFRPSFTGEPVMISLHPVELEKALDMVGFYDADIEVVVDGKKFKVGCQDVQFHPVSDRPIHVDFLRK